ISCPAPRERSRAADLLDRLGRGETVALVSDAGMPSFSDPGAQLVEAAAAGGYAVEVVPGPSAPAAALAISGLPAVPHYFAGFLPSRPGERRRARARGESERGLAREFARRSGRPAREIYAQAVALEERQGSPSRSSGSPA